MQTRCTECIQVLNDSIGFSTTSYFFSNSQSYSHLALRLLQSNYVVPILAYLTTAHCSSSIVHHYQATKCCTTCMYVFTVAYNSEWLRLTIKPSP